MHFRVGQKCTYRMPGNRIYECKVVKVRPGHALAHLYQVDVQVVTVSARSASSPHAVGPGSGGGEPPALSVSSSRVG